MADHTPTTNAEAHALDEQIVARAAQAIADRRRAESQKGAPPVPQDFEAARTVLAVAGPALAARTLRDYADGLDRLRNAAGTPTFEWITLSMRTKAQDYDEGRGADA